MDKKNILVAFGGASPEHEVSVLTAMQAISALDEAKGIQIKPLYISKTGRWLTGNHLKDLKNYENLTSLENESHPCFFAQNEYGQAVLQEASASMFKRAVQTPVYAVLPAFHGSNGENGSFQGICEMFNIPYAGSGVMGSAVGMDKVTAKAICKAYQIPVVESTDFFETDWIQNQRDKVAAIERLGYPVVVKPVHLGSSIGVRVVENRETLIEAIETAFRYDAHLLVEKAISPLTEINCSVMGTPLDYRMSVCERPLGKEELLSFEDKYLKEEGSKGMASADRVIPADIPAELSESIQQTAGQIFQVLSCSGVARLDFLVNSETYDFYFNEINTIPGSFSFYLWKESDVDFRSLLNKMIDIAIETHRQKNGRIQSYETNLLSQKAVKGMKGLKRNK
jgi:D-alanine-D-alanine ligase